jgi:hypothetical protein
MRVMGVMGAMGAMGTMGDSLRTPSFSESLGGYG